MKVVTRLYLIPNRAVIAKGGVMTEKPKIDVEPEDLPVLDDSLEEDLKVDFEKVADPPEGNTIPSDI